MEPVAFVVDKFRGLTKSTQELFDGLIHGHPQRSARRHPVFPKLLLSSFLIYYLSSHFPVPTVDMFHCLAVIRTDFALFLLQKKKRKIINLS